MCVSCHGCRNSDSFWKLYDYFCKFIGILTAIGLWGIAVETALFGHWLGYYLLVVAPLVTFLETLFIVDLISTTSLREDSNHGCVRCCLKFHWIDQWRRGLLYILFSIVCFVRPQKQWLPCIAGTMLIICGVVYFIKTVRQVGDRHKVEEHAKQQTYDRYTDEIEEDLENNDLGAVSGKPIFATSESIADQDEIMEL